MSAEEVAAHYQDLNAIPDAIREVISRSWQDKQAAAVFRSATSALFLGRGVNATTAYEVGHDPSADEVHANSPYSTYTNAGLPPTPICSPSIECLQAVCSPNKDALGKYYFFYFQNDKYTFSETYDEHQAAFS